MTRAAFSIAAIAIALAAAAGGLLLAQNRRSEPAQQVVSGKPLLDLQLTDLQKQRQDMAQWHGKVLVVNFWATWCTPCREEMPEFSDASKVFAAKGVQFVGIGIDSVENVQKFTKEVEVAYPLLVGENAAMQAAAVVGNNLMALPFTAVIDRGGQVVHTKLGKMRRPELDSAIDDALRRG